MTIREICESVSRLPDGGIVNDRTRYDQGYLESTVGNFRARVIRLLYLKNRRINPVCYQKHWPTFEEDLQDDKCCVKFRHPEVISLDNLSDGFRFIGTPDFSVAFARIQSRSWLSTFNNNKVTTTAGNRRPTVLYDGSQQILEVRGLPELEIILTESILADPLSIPTYNKKYDQYPLSEDMIQDMLQMIFSEETSIASSIPLKPGQPILNPPRTRK